MTILGVFRTSSAYEEIIKVRSHAFKVIPQGKKINNYKLFGHLLIENIIDSSTTSKIAQFRTRNQFNSFDLNSKSIIDPFNPCILETRDTLLVDDLETLSHLPSALWAFLSFLNAQQINLEEVSTGKNLLAYGGLDWINSLLGEV